MFYARGTRPQYQCELQVAAKEDELAEKDDMLAAKDEQLAAKDAQMTASLREAAEINEEYITELTTTQQQLETEVSSLTTAQQQLESEVASLTAQLGEAQEAAADRDRQEADMQAATKRLRAQVLLSCATNCVEFCVPVSACVFLMSVCVSVCGQR